MYFVDESLLVLLIALYRPAVGVLVEYEDTIIKPFCRIKDVAEPLAGELAPFVIQVHRTPALSQFTSRDASPVQRAYKLLAEPEAIFYEVHSAHSLFSLSVGKGTTEGGGFYNHAFWLSEDTTQKPRSRTVTDYGAKVRTKKKEFLA